jgi:hypothetical protein
MAVNDIDKLNKNNTIYNMYNFDENTIVFKRAAVVSNENLFALPEKYEISNDGTSIAVTKIYNMASSIEHKISNKIKENIKDLKEINVNEISKKTSLPTTEVPTAINIATVINAVPITNIDVPIVASIVVPTSVVPTSVVPTSVVPTSVVPTSVVPTSVVTNVSLTNNWLLKSSLVDLIDSVRSIVAYTDRVYMLKHILKYIGQEYDMGRAVIISNEQEIKLKLCQIITTLSTSQLSHLCGVLVVAMI